MRQERIDLLQEDLRRHLFALLDAEPETDGPLAGRIAQAVATVFGELLEDHFHGDQEANGLRIGWLVVDHERPELAGLVS